MNGLGPSPLGLDTASADARAYSIRLGGPAPTPVE